MKISDLIEVMKLFPKERRVKAIKVSKKFYKYIKKNLGASDDVIKEIYYNFIDRLDGIPIVIDKDVEIYEIEYEED